MTRGEPERPGVRMPPPDPLWACVPTSVNPSMAERAAAVQAGKAPVSAVRPAASVVLVRDAGADARPKSRPGVQVWMMRRARSMAFAAGAWAFPGGGVDTVDGAVNAAVPGSAASGSAELGSAATGSAEFGPGDPPDELSRCAVREVAEETGLHLDAESLITWARWVTPTWHPRRYDTWFFLADANGTAPRNTSTEADRTGWFAPGDLLDDPDAVLFPPTRVILARLAEADSVAGLIEQAPETIVAIMNRIDFSGDEPRLVIEYATGNLDEIGERNHR